MATNNLRTATTTPATETLGAERKWTIFHRSKDSSNATSTVDVFLGCNAAAAANYTAATDKLVLSPGMAVTVGPDVTTLYYVTASGEAQIQIMPDDPTFI